MTPRILLTGGTGFLGSQICHSLVASRHEVCLLKRSTSKLERVRDLLPRVDSANLDETKLEEVFEKKGPFEVVIHCATDYGRKDVDVLQLIDANLILPLRLLELGAKHGIRAFINSDTVLDKRVSEYSLSKKQFVEWLALSSKKFVCCNVALEHFYGPGDDQSKFVSSIISQFIQGVGRISLTPGLQKRDFIYIDDVVSAFELVLADALSGPPRFVEFEVGSGQSVEIRSVVEEIRSLIPDSKSEPAFGALPYRENEVMESRIDLGPLQKLGWSPKVPLREGLARTVEFERNRSQS